ncbi:hypothetical protein LC593_04665 [Nostoc sp. CHAB 5844]|nr:hypothetical protein [Nostoc sp. CHAB 5844]
MTQRNNRNEILQTFLGILLLLGCHAIAIILIFVLAYVADVYFRNISYASLYVFMIGGFGFLFWQLFYVIPLCIFLQRRQRIAMRNGVIIGAVITALLSGGCFLLLNIRF